MRLVAAPPPRTRRPGCRRRAATSPLRITSAAPRGLSRRGGYRSCSSLREDRASAGSACSIASDEIVPSVLDDVHRAPVGDPRHRELARRPAARRASRASGRARRRRRGGTAAPPRSACGRRCRSPCRSRSRSSRPRRGSAPRGRGASDRCRRRRGSGTRPRRRCRSRASARAARPRCGRSSGCVTRAQAWSSSSSSRHPGVLEPAAVVVGGAPLGVGRPDDLRHRVGELAVPLGARAAELGELLRGELLGLLADLPVLLPQLDEDRDLRAQDLRVERLEDVVDRADLVAAEDVLLLLRERRQEDDRDRARPLALLDHLGRLEPVHARHLDVEQDDREVVARAAGCAAPPPPTPAVTSSWPSGSRIASSASRFCGRSSTSRRDGAAPSGGRHLREPAELDEQRRDLADRRDASPSGTRASAARGISSRSAVVGVLDDRRPAELGDAREAAARRRRSRRSGRRPRSARGMPRRPSRRGRRSRGARTARARRSRARACRARRAGGSRAARGRRCPARSSSLSPASRTFSRRDGAEQVAKRGRMRLGRAVLGDHDGGVELGRQPAEERCARRRARPRRRRSRRGRGSSDSPVELLVGVELLVASPRSR